MIGEDRLCHDWTLNSCYRLASRIAFWDPNVWEPQKRRWALTYVLAPPAPGEPVIDGGRYWCQGGRT